MKDKRNFMQWFIIGCLLALLITGNYFAILAHQERLTQAERTEERQAVYEEHAQQLQAWRARQQRLLEGIADSYHASAYDPGVERIAEQQLIAAEYQIVLLQAIAQQNAEMIELMLVMGP